MCLVSRVGAVRAAFGIRIFVGFRASSWSIGLGISALGV